MGSSFDLGGGGNSFPFENIGANVTGRIVDITEVQQTDMDNGTPVFWDNGQPKMMVAVVLQTDLRDPNDPADDGKRSVYLKGSRKPESESSMAAVLAAVKAATGGSEIKVGGTLGLMYVGDGVAAVRGKNPPKRYQARYQAPSVNLGDPAAQQPPAGPPPGQPGWGSTPPVNAPAQTGWAGQAQAASPAQQGPPPGWGAAPPAAPPAQQAPPPPDPATDPGYAAYQQWQASQQAGGQGG